MAPDPTTPIPTVTGTVREQFQELASSAADADNHGVALDALRELSKKPGWQTTEFYLSLALGAFGAVLTQMPGKELVGALLSAAAVLSYNLSRGAAKKAAGLFLAFALVLGASGCTTAREDFHLAASAALGVLTAAANDPTALEEGKALLVGLSSKALSPVDQAIVNQGLAYVTAGNAAQGAAIIAPLVTGTAKAAGP